MPDYRDLLDLMANTAGEAVGFLAAHSDSLSKDHRYSGSVSKEMKASVDTILEERVLGGLAPAGLPVLSEESSGDDRTRDELLRFVVDPLDGTVNYIRGLGPASVSIGLCSGNTPLCGAVAIYPAGDVARGGRNLGAYLNGDVISVSTVRRAEEAVLCTGIPARLMLDNEHKLRELGRTLSRYGKVRMLGAASISLLQVAKGSAELYAEDDIMLWDVAAGLAIVEGAGGVTRLETGSQRHAVKARATNGWFDA